MANNLDLGNGNTGKLLWEFSIPAIIGMSVNAFYNVISRIFVGQGVNYLAIAAVTVAMPVMILLFAVAMLIGIGATALISIRLGEQKKEEADKIAGNATLLLILLPLLFSIAYFLFSEPVLRLFGATSPDVLPYARDYMHIIMIGAVPGSIAFGLNNFIRAEGNPRFAMFTQVIGGVINIILHYVFIFILGWGVKGAALAVIVGQTVSAVWVISYFLRGTSMIKIKLKNMKLQIPIAIKIMAIGFAPFAMQIANSVQQTILNKIIMFYGGDLALSAVGIVMSVGMILIMPIVGISQGAQPIIGYNYGAQRFDRVKETLKKGILASTVLAIIGFAGTRFFAIPVVALFSKGDAALTQLAAHALVTFFACLPIVGFHILGANYFQAVGKPIQSTILSLSRQVLIFIPLLLILPNFWGIEGVWRTAPIADILAVLLTAIVLFYEMKNINPKPTLAMESN
ncbi:MATE family efflux transporter [Desulfallas thermosapovorans]|uniref:Multidrug export protein MepA n=1 Tax=Desulfallas thermosapovorans DSM 6562 TaxID=1121431 RepID=A0A5S4ZTF2_9FIRM|nr:MATE family efflux transporter [Desulfallas thermosapovorans]TYO95368.1 putative MATE family efflux protein [Desulfallas thermosapovorans DSM 6562]